MFVFCLKLRVNGDMISFSIALITGYIDTTERETITESPQLKALKDGFDSKRFQTE